jgi:hypothetical protein
MVELIQTWIMRCYHALGRMRDLRRPQYVLVQKTVFVCKGTLGVVALNAMPDL